MSVEWVGYLNHNQHHAASQIVPTFTYVKPTMAGVDFSRQLKSKVNFP